ncbi:MAG TPA: hypothetical protein VMG62_00675, partial [Solirubrobacteraceae bacterium]|nr:hypothetical protein [Solirubrobacteraceae bacterium]
MAASRGEPEPMSPARLCAGVRATGLLEGGGPLVAMLSGGRDSVWLLDVAVAILGAGNVRAL